MESQGRGFIPGDLSFTRVVLLTNAGKTCRLSGYPTLIGVKSDGEKKTIFEPAKGTYATTHVFPTLLATGEAGQLWITTPGAGCGALNNPDPTLVKANTVADTYQDVAIELPAGRGVVTADGITVDVACGISESGLGAPPAPRGLPLGTPATLTVTIATVLTPAFRPSGYPAGSTLTYTILLSNETKDPVSFRSCPRYTVTMLGGSASSSGQPTIRPPRTFPFDCRAVGSVSPGQTKKVAMSLRLPEEKATSLATLRWKFDVPGARADPPWTAKTAGGTATTLIIAGTDGEPAPRR